MDRIIDDPTDFAETIFRAQPFSALLGARLEKFSGESVEIVLPITSQLKQQHGFVHGGVLSYLADNAITFAGGLALSGDALTSEFKINYMRPATGEKLVARSEIRGAGKRQVVCTCEVFAIEQGQRMLCAIAQGTVVPV